MSENNKKKKTHEEDEEVYQITPKGIAWAAACDVGWIRGGMDDEKFDRFWDKFELGMYKAGYIRNESDLSA